MPERIDICCLFERAPTDRQTTITRLFEADPSWMGKPFSCMLVDSQQIYWNGPWFPSDRRIAGSLGQKFLFVYSDATSGDQGSRSCVGLSESAGRAVYTLSFPLSVIRNMAIGEAEHRFLRIYESCTSIGLCVALIGAELAIQPAQSITDHISEALRPSSLVRWLIAPKTFLPDIKGSLAVAATTNGSAMLRHLQAGLLSG